MNPDRARALLTTELSELDDSARFAAEGTADTAAGDEPASTGPVDQHPGEHATEVTNRMEADALVRTVDEQRRRVQEALRRLDDGEYGRCTVCGRDIDDERLEARPEAITCRDHADVPVTT